jgi:predicted small secreted protein
VASSATKLVGIRGLLCVAPLPIVAHARFGERYHRELIAAVLALAVVAGCNTMADAAKDVQKAGESLENSAEKHK